MPTAAQKNYFQWVLDTPSNQVNEVSRARHYEFVLWAQDEFGCYSTDAQEIVDALTYESSIDLNVDRTLLKECLSKLFLELSPRNRDVLYFRYFEDFSVTQIASILDITKEKVRCIENKAIRRLRRSNNIKQLQDFLILYV